MCDTSFIVQKGEDAPKFSIRAQFVSFNRSILGVFKEKVIIRQFIHQTRAISTHRCQSESRRIFIRTDRPPQLAAVSQPKAFQSIRHKQSRFRQLRQLERDIFVIYCLFSTVNRVSPTFYLDSVAGWRRWYNWFDLSNCMSFLFFNRVVLCCYNGQYDRRSLVILGRFLIHDLVELWSLRFLTEALVWGCHLLNMGLFVLTSDAAFDATFLVFYRIGGCRELYVLALSFSGHLMNVLKVAP